MISRRAALAAVVLAALPTGLAACSSDTNSISAQANKGDDKNYVSGDGTVSTVAPADRGKPVSFSGTLLNGQKWSSAQAEGKVVVVNVWGAWCPPCQKELPELQKAWEGWQKAGQPVQLIGIDQRDSVTNAQATLTAKGITYPSLADDGGAVLLSLQNSVTAYPTTLVLDTQHRIAARVSGPTTYLTLTGLVSDVLKEKA